MDYTPPPPIKIKQVSQGHLNEVRPHHDAANDQNFVQYILVS